MKRYSLPALAVVAWGIALGTQGLERDVDLSPTTWKADYERFMQAQLVDRTEAGVASGKHGAVTVAYHGLAARAGLEALKQGGNAMDAALTTAVTQVALTAGAPNTPDFLLPASSGSSQSIVRVPKGKFPRAVLDATGRAYEEISPKEERFSGEGLWVGISRDSKTGELRAGSHNRNNSAAVAH